MTQDIDLDDFVDSGPFCIHWSDVDCDEVCKSCSHPCAAHGGGYDECSMTDCECKKFKDDNV